MVIPTTNPFKLFVRLMQDLDGSVDEWRFSYIRMANTEGVLAILSLLERINTAPDTMYGTTNLISFKSNSLSIKIIWSSLPLQRRDTYFHHLTLRLGQLSSLCHNIGQRNLVHLDISHNINLGHYLHGSIPIGFGEQEVVNTKMSY